MTEVVGGFLVLTGATLTLLAAVGVLRMPDIYLRMQASGKASTLGLGCLLAGTALHLGDLSSLVRAVSIGAFVLLTSPISTHVIARAAYLTGVPLWRGTRADEWKEDRAQAGQKEV